MAEQLLHAAKVGAAVEHMGGKAVAKRVRTDSGVEAGYLEVFIHLPADAAGAQAFAVFIYKQNLAVEVAVVLCPFVPEFHIVLDDLQDGGANRTDSFFFAFSPDVDDLAKEIDIIEVHRDKLTDPHTGAVERFHNGPVAGAEPGVNGGRLKQAFDFFIFEESGEPFLLLWRADSDDWVGAYAVPFDKELIEAAKRCELACDGGFGVLLLVQYNHIASYGVDVG